MICRIAARLLQPYMFPDHKPFFAVIAAAEDGGTMGAAVLHDQQQGADIAGRPVCDHDFGKAIL